MTNKFQPPSTQHKHKLLNNGGNNLCIIKDNRVSCRLVKDLKNSILPRKVMRLFRKITKISKSFYRLSGIFSHKILLVAVSW